jgi:hypothetical protein
MRTNKMKKKYGNYNHLCRIPNTKENMDMIKTLRKFMKSSESRWQLVLRGRHPIDGKGYGYGGSLALKYAKSVSIYVVLRESVKAEERKKYNERWIRENAISQRDKQTLNEVFGLMNTWNARRIS